jgi:hypothetical protein
MHFTQSATNTDDLHGPAPAGTVHAHPSLSDHSPLGRLNALTAMAHVQAFKGDRAGAHGTLDDARRVFEAAGSDEVISDYAVPEWRFHTFASVLLSRMGDNARRCGSRIRPIGPGRHRWSGSPPTSSCTGDSCSFGPGTSPAASSTGGQPWRDCRQTGTASRFACCWPRWSGRPAPTTRRRRAGSARRLPWFGDGPSSVSSRPSSDERSRPPARAAGYPGERSNRPGPDSVEVAPGVKGSGGS